MDYRIQSQIEFYDTIAETFAKEHRDVGSIGDIVLSKVKPSRDLLELACGAGRWTEKLCQLSGEVVAVDSSPNLLDLSRERLSGKNVKLIQANIFSWPTLGTFDAVFFAFWLSHVPQQLFDEFWAYIRGLLRPEGQVVFVDSAWTGIGGGGDRRRTPDGRTYEIIKVAHSADKLTERLRKLGFSSEIHTITDNIYVGTASVEFQGGNSHE